VGLPCAGRFRRFAAETNFLVLPSEPLDAVVLFLILLLLAVCMFVRRFAKYWFLRMAKSKSRPPLPRSNRQQLTFTAAHDLAFTTPKALNPIAQGRAAHPG